MLLGPTSVSPTIRPECELGLGACTPAPLPASRRSTHFKPLGILKSPHATTACGAPSRSSDLNGQGRPPFQGGQGHPKPSIPCDRERERVQSINRRIIPAPPLEPYAGH